LSDGVHHASSQSSLLTGCSLSLFTGAGYDQVDVHACSSRSISVSNTPSAVDAATADLAIFLLIGALRNFNAGMSSLRRGEWRGLVPAGSQDQNPPLRLGHDPQGKTLGILGMGGIGKEVAIRAVAFGMKIAYYNRRRLPKEEEVAAGNAEYREFDELLAKSDVLSLNLPLNVRLSQA
jgi:glyoxylate reductase